MPIFLREDESENSKEKARGRSLVVKGLPSLKEALRMVTKASNVDLIISLLHPQGLYFVEVTVE